MFGIKVTLGWVSANDNETGHKIYRSTSPMDVNSLPEPIAILGVDSVSYEDTTVEFNTLYYYRIGVFNENGETVSDEYQIQTVESLNELWVDTSIVQNVLSTALTTHGHKGKTISMYNTTTTGSSKWRGGVLAPNGKIYCAPFNASTILIIDTNQQTAVLTEDAMGLNFTGYKWIGGSLAPNGKIYCVPYEGDKILIIDPVTDTATLSDMGVVITGSDNWWGSVLGADGKIYGIPYNSPDILIINPLDDTASRSTMGLSISGSKKCKGGALAPNGKIYCTPYDYNKFIIIDTNTGLASQTTMGHGYMNYTYKWSGAAMGGNGKIYMVPHSHTHYVIIDPNTNTITTKWSEGSNTKFQGLSVGSDGKIYATPHSYPSILIIDPETDEYSITNMGYTFTNSYKWSGCCLGKNGKLYFIPSSEDMVCEISFETSVPELPMNVALSPHINNSL